MPNSPREAKDIGFKAILGDHVLFAQFLHDFIQIDMLKDVTEDDIEDLTERFIMLGLDSKDGDTVKRINLRDRAPLFVIGVVEHQQEINYRMSFRLLQYCVFIWDNYEKEENAKRKGASDRKDFMYPPILPVVYYTGGKKWTSPRNFIDKVHFKEVFKPYIPEFEYLLIDSNNYSREDLVRNRDILSLFLLIDKLKYADDLPYFKDIPPEILDEIGAKTPDHLKKLVRDVAQTFLARLDIPQEERDEITGYIMEGRFARMFTLIDGYSVTETRRIAREEGLMEGLMEGRMEGMEKGRMEIATKMIANGFDFDMIATITGLDREAIRQLEDAARQEPLVG